MSLLLWVGTTVAQFYFQYLPFESIWHSLAPHVTFVMEPTDTGVKEVFCEINCYQIQRENIWARIKIAEKMSMVSFKHLIFCEWIICDILNMTAVVTNDVRHS